MQQLSLSLRIGYGVGAIGDAVKSLGFGLFLLFFYTSVRGLPGSMVGAGLAISLLWDAAVDPYMGRLSDRLARSPKGRQRLMTIGSLVMGPAFYAVFSPPAGLSGLSLLIWMVATNIVLRSGHSAFMVPYYALGGELTRDYYQRTALTGVRTACAMLGTMTAAVLSFTVFFRNAGTAIKPVFGALGYSNMAFWFGAIMTSSALATSLVMRNAPLLPTLDSEHEARSHWSVELRQALRHQPFRVLSASGCLFFLAAVMNATVSVHYLTYFAQLPDGVPFAMFQGAFYLAAFAGARLWSWATLRIEKQQAYRYATLATAAVMASSYLLVGDGRMFGTGNVMAVVVGNALAGLFASAVWVLPPSMLSDIVDEYEHEHGKRPVGSIFGFYSLFVQCAGSCALIINGLLLDRFARFVGSRQAQEPLTVDRLGLLFGPLPALLLLTAAVVMFRYPLTKDKLLQVQSALRSPRGRAQAAP